MQPTITIRLPDLPPAQALALVPQIALAAARRRLSLPTIAGKPAVADNPCEHEGCEWIDSYVDAGGVTWHVYDCGGTIESYRA